MLHISRYKLLLQTIRKRGFTVNMHRMPEASKKTLPLLFPATATVNNCFTFSNANVYFKPVKKGGFTVNIAYSKYVSAYA